MELVTAQPKLVIHLNRTGFESIILTLPPTAYRIRWLLRGRGLKDPPLRYHGRSHFGLYIAIDHLLTWTYKGHMPQFGLKSQKLMLSQN